LGSEELLRKFLASNFNSSMGIRSPKSKLGLPLNQDQFNAELAKLDPDEIRQRIAVCIITGPHKIYAEEYLRKLESDRSHEAAARKEAREEETLSIARQALANSQMATRLSAISILLAIALALLNIIDWYSK
jgi:hypothetical protein